MKNFFLFLFGWFCYTFETVIFYIENRYKFFYWKSNDFYQHLFSIENHYEFFHWKSSFCKHHFFLKTNTKFYIQFTVYFEFAILFWKSIQIFLLKIKRFLSASNSRYWNSIANFYLIYGTFWTTIWWYRSSFCVENQ